jgi:hypothetical protein
MSSMPTRALLICLLAILVSFTKAHADGLTNGASLSTIEYRPKKAFFLLYDFQHWAGLVYQYTGYESNQTNASNSSSHRFQELYHISIGGAVVDPRKFNFRLNGEIWFEQSMNHTDAAFNGSSSGNEFRGQYDFNGSIMDRSWYPSFIRSSLYQDTVNAPFVPVHTNTTYNNNAEVNILKDPFRAKLFYSRISIDTSGGGYDSSTTTDTVSLSGTHQYRDISSTSLAGSWYNTTAAAANSGSSGSGYQVTASNNLNFDREKRYSLYSMLIWQDQTIAGLPQQNTNLSETFTGQLGKALLLTANYNYADSSTVSFAGLAQKYSSNSAGLSLQHRLFSSLTTRLYGRGSWSDLLGGTEEVYTGGAVVTYNKRINPATQLTAEALGQYQVTDRNVVGTDLSVRDEQHQVVQQGDIIRLNVTGTLRSVVSVTSRIGSGIITYQEFLDYTVNLALGTIQIVPGGTIPPGTLLFISYIIGNSPQLKYSTNTLALSSSLSMMEGRYLLNGSYYLQTQDRISGQLVNNSLNNTYIKQISFTGSHSPLFYTMQYYDYSSGPSKYYYLQGWVQYWHQFPIGNLQLQAREQYTVYDSVGYQGGYGQNTLSGSATYSRPLNIWSQIQVSLIAVDNRWGPQGNTDYLYFKVFLQARYNMITLSLVGSSGWRFFGNTTLRDDYVRLELTRYF